jgi:hypothetical protein
VSRFIEAHIEWTTPAPLWRAIGDVTDPAVRRRFRTPSILRFANDDFMDEFMELMTARPEGLSEFVAVAETWTAPPVEPDRPSLRSGLALKLERARAAAVRRLEAKGAAARTAQQRAVAPRALKLFQPAHQRFYLVSACLVCRTLGLPDRRLDLASQERVSFVVRLLRPRAAADLANPDPHDCDEFGLVDKSWQFAGDPTTLLVGEVQRPLSPITYLETDQRARRLFVGIVPVGERENLLQATQPTSVAQDPPPTPIDGRQMLLKSQILGPWSVLDGVAEAAYGRVSANEPHDESTTDQKRKILQQANDQIQALSWYVLLDLARYFERYLPSLWQEIQAGGNGTTLPPPEQAILNTLNGTLDAGGALSMKAGLQQAFAAAGELEGVKTPYQSAAPSGWPSFPFVFSMAAMTGVQYLQPNVTRDDFERQIVHALPAADARPPLPVRLTAQASANTQAPAWFTLRCVFEQPNCGAMAPPLLSEPAVAFQLAAYFDPDAPARPIRIGLPVDTTPAGLRKFDKNTAFVMSDVLCGQVNRMGGTSFGDLIRSVLPFPFHKDLDSGGGPCTSDGAAAGMVCSFSIPIITICALILLIIFVKLLDIVFFWRPFFQICLPLPKFSAKK